ncbi:hypothetical protein Pelo_14406 [Pelomyxa schiedti]|nr:hypothetical protein Pelo_14406 [Pelomyxa schiedti]
MILQPAVGGKGRGIAVLGAPPQMPGGAARDSWNALIVADLHISPGAYHSEAEQQRALMDIPAIVQKHGVEQIIILGDLFQMVAYPGYPELYLDVIDKLVACNVPIIAIGGNHDRQWFDLYKNDWIARAHGLLSIYSEVMLELHNTCASEGVDPSELQRAYLTHDGGNGQWITPKQRESFVMGLRSCNGIRPTDLLVCGHVHWQEDYMSTNNSAIVGCLTANRHYGVLRTSNATGNTTPKFQLSLLQHS